MELLLLEIVAYVLVYFLICSLLYRYFFLDDHLRRILKVNPSQFEFAFILLFPLTVVFIVVMQIISLVKTLRKED